MKPDFEAVLKKASEEADTAVRSHLPEDPASPGKLAEAVCYSVSAGGKRLRPILMKSTYELFGGNADISAFLAGIEYIHCSSLIHDDLPPLDNDDLRHAKPSVHVKYGEALGVLAGDALLNYAYEVMLKGVSDFPDTENALKALSLIAEKTGYKGMLGGQDADTEADKKMIKISSEDDVRYIYKNKTCALFEAAMGAGALLAGADEKYAAVLEEAAEDLGFAFQIRDDILDLTGDESKIGKPVGSDLRNDKATYVSLFGIGKAEEKIATLTASACGSLDKLPGDASFLKDLVEKLSLRDR